jgi:hypothetical protein
MEQATVENKAHNQTYPNHRERIISLVLTKVPLSFLAFFFAKLAYLVQIRVLFGFLAFPSVYRGNRVKLHAKRLFCPWRRMKKISNLQMHCPGFQMAYQ